MKSKKLIKSGFAIFNVLFLIGLVFSLVEINANEYLPQHLFNLAIITASGIIDKIILIGLLILFLIFGIRLFWQAYLSRLVGIEIKLNKPLLLKVTKWFLFVFISLMILEEAVIFIKKEGFIYRNTLLIQLLLILFILFKALQIKKAGISRIWRPVKKGFSLIVSPTFSWLFLFVFIIINLLTFYHSHLKRPDGPNIILIIADALRADHLGCYGYARDTSPNIDRFASDSLLFENAWANSSWTKPSVGSILTSLFPHQHGAVYWSSVLAHNRMTITEILKNLGYRTYGVQTNPVLSKAHGFNQGFDYYEQIDLARGEKITKEFSRWLKANPGRPFFAYLHYYDTHVPYNAPKAFGEKFGVNSYQLFKAGEFKTIDVRLLNLLDLSDEDKKSLINLYDAGVNYVDYNFKCILDSLDEMSILDKTIIVFTSDHGEEFWEHGNYEHGHTLYEELLRVPLIIGYPGKVRGERIKSNVQLVDILPIIMQLSGNSINKNDTEGLNLTEIISNKQEVIFAEGILLGDYKRAIIKSNWKLIENSGYVNQDTLELYGDLTRYVIPKYKFGYELYDLQNDPGENKNLVEQKNKEFIKLRARMRHYKVTPENFNKETKIERNKKLEDLKSLGYIR